MKALSKSTVAKLRRVVKAIKANAHLLDMDEWCNSHACFAGFAVVELDPKEWVSYEEGIAAVTKRQDREYKKSCEDYVRNAANRLLGLTDDDDDGRLYFRSSWPSDLMDRYDLASTDKERANIVGENVERFIAGD